MLRPHATKNEELLSWSAVSTESNSLPKYFQISREIIASIQRGVLQPGSPVPSENEIIERFHVSNTTARKALAESMSRI